MSVCVALYEMEGQASRGLVKSYIDEHCQPNNELSHSRNSLTQAVLFLTLSRTSELRLC